MKPECSVVVRAYNEEKHIGKLFAGIRQQTLKNIQVILVDSGSTDQTVDIARQYDIQVVHIDPKSFTFGRSLNLGISHAEADILVFASAHVYPVYPDWLEHMVSPFSDGTTAVCYGKQRGTKDSKFSEQQVFYHWFPETSRLQEENPFCNNANAAIRHSLWLEHPYDETIPALEDLAWAKWAMQKGYKVHYSAEAEIVHIHHETWKGVYNRYRREGMAFKQIYPESHFSYGDLYRLLRANILADLKAASLQRQTSKQFLPILRFRWMQFWGTYQGYRQSSHALNWQMKRTFYYPNADLNGQDSQSHRISPIEYMEDGKKIQPEGEEK
jgi:glycosyltransferase involved in cell wall biosynthesis